MTWIFSKCARIHSTLQGQETSQKDDEVTLFDPQKHVYSCDILVVNLLTNGICAFYAKRSTQDQTMSRSTSSVWIQGLGQTLEHNYIDFVHQLAVVFYGFLFSAIEIGVVLAQKNPGFCFCRGW